MSRCAIYTRKSTEHNLDLAFTSLDAQREACEAYITSQAGEGWRLLSDRYDDGAFSGASLERPALQRLLADVRARRVDIVVVYKVDRPFAVRDVRCWVCPIRAEIGERVRDKMSDGYFGASRFRMRG